MNYAIIIADGAADLPIDALGGRTPLEAASTPNLDALVRRGMLGTAATTPPGFAAGSDVCTMSLLGYDPAKYHTGRAPLEAAALGLDPGPNDWIFRLNLVTVGTPGSADAGRMLDHSAGAISDAEARELVVELHAHWRTKAPDLVRNMTLTPGVSYRNILVEAPPANGVSRDYGTIATTPPHEIPGQLWREYLPKPSGSEGPTDATTTLNLLITLSAEFLPSHPINKSRTHRGLRPANMAWVWGQGKRPAIPRFSDKFAVHGAGAMITPVDLLAGIAALIGWDRPKVPGMTGYHDNDYAAQGRAACDALRSHPIVCCHVEAPDEASHQGDWKTKVAAIEAIDRHVVGPIASALHRPGAPGQAWRLLVLPDHYTLVSTRRHDATPAPFLIVGSNTGDRGRAHAETRFTERLAAQSGLHISPGHALMSRFLSGG